MKPVEQLSAAERLREVVALQRLRAAGGMDGATRTDLAFLRQRSATGPLLYSFQRAADPWEAMIVHFVAEAEREYDRLAQTWGMRDPAGFRLLVREKGLGNVPKYRKARDK